MVSHLKDAASYPSRSSERNPRRRSSASAASRARQAQRKSGSSQPRRRRQGLRGRGGQEAPTPILPRCLLDLSAFSTSAASTRRSRPAFRFRRRIVPSSAAAGSVCPGASAQRDGVTSSRPFCLGAPAHVSSPSTSGTATVPVGFRRRLGRTDGSSSAGASTARRSACFRVGPCFRYAGPAFGRSCLNRHRPLTRSAGSRRRDSRPGCDSVRGRTS